MNLDIAIFGLSITSSWANGHATTYRALTKALERRGHRVTFLERDVPWYREHCDLPSPSYCRTELYAELKDVPAHYRRLVSEADLVIIGSYVPNGAVLAEWITRHASGVTAFYDIDTPVTLAMLAAGRSEYITARLIPRFDLYLSFTDGPILEIIENRYGSPRARSFYCSVDSDFHKPVPAAPRWNLGYLGTYCEDRQSQLARLLLGPAIDLPQGRFVVAGARYPQDTAWPSNVERIEHLPPDAHPPFYCSQRFTLNITRSNMVEAGFSPSVRLFEAAACGVPIITDRWTGIESVLKPGREVLIADRPEQVISILGDLTEERRLDIAASARKRILAGHTAEKRACQLERYYEEVASRNRVNGRRHARPPGPRLGLPAITE
jgi:spore maturation protein CgeB